MDLVERLKGELEQIPKFVLEKINKMVIDYNENSQDNPKIHAVYFHSDPSSGKGKFYLINDGPYSEKLEDEIMSLGLEVYHQDKVDVDLIAWPCGYDGIDDYGFFKELCVFDYVRKVA